MKERKTNKELIMAIVRMAILFITGINAVLTAKGINPVPLDESLIMEVASYVITGIAALWAWWKNNNVTRAAQIAQDTLVGIKAQKAALKEANK